MGSEMCIRDSGASGRGSPPERVATLHTFVKQRDGWRLSSRYVAALPPAPRRARAPPREEAEEDRAEADDEAARRQRARRPTMVERGVRWPFSPASPTPPWGF